MKSADTKVNFATHVPSDAPLKMAKGRFMGFFNLEISEKECEQLFRLLRDRLPESRLDLSALGHQDEHPLLEREVEVVRELLDKVNKAKPRLWYSRLMAQEITASAQIREASCLFR
jgi:hypothetical protein